MSSEPLPLSKTTSLPVIELSISFLTEKQQEDVALYKTFLTKGVITTEEFEKKRQDILKKSPRGLSRCESAQGMNSGWKSPRIKLEEERQKKTEEQKALYKHLSARELSKLEKLTLFYNKNFITEDEFERKKDEIYQLCITRITPSNDSETTDTCSVPETLSDTNFVPIEDEVYSDNEPEDDDQQTIIKTKMDVEKVRLKALVKRGQLDEDVCNEMILTPNLVERGIVTTDELKVLGALAPTDEEDYTYFSTPAKEVHRKSHIRKIEVLSLRDQIDYQEVKVAPPLLSHKNDIQPIDPTPFYMQDYKTIIVNHEDERIEIKDGIVEFATLSKLIEEMTHPQKFDAHMMHTFFLTFRSFTDIETLFTKLKERFNYPPNPNCTFQEFAMFKDAFLDRVRLRVVSCVKYWIENFYFFDFLGNEKAVAHLSDFIGMLDSSNAKPLAKMISRTVEKIGSEVVRIQAPLKCPPRRTVKYTIIKRNQHVLDFHRKEIARQLALIDFEMFSKIQAKECLNSSWSRESRETMATNINQMTQFFNKVSAFVGGEIVKCEKQSDRVKVICKFIKVAKRSLDYHNYNGVFSIMSGMSVSAIHRLKSTWEAVPKEYMDIHNDLNDFMSRDGNFKRLRVALREGNPPSIPYVGLYLKDLTFIEDGSPKYVTRDGVKMINFTKCSQFAAVIRDIQTFQNQRYAFEVYPELRDLILNVSVMSEKEMYDLSLLREARTRQSRKMSATDVNKRTTLKLY